MVEITNKRSNKYLGIILKKTKFRESSIIFELLSPATGKISFIAKGVRKAKSKSNGIYELFNIVAIEGYSSPNSSLVISKSATVIESKLPKNSYDSFVAASIAIEFIQNIEFLESENKQFYTLLISFFDYLPKVKKNHILIIWRFLLKAYTLLGINLNISHCTICDKKLEEINFFSHKNHGFVCKNCLNLLIKNEFIKIPKNLAEIIIKLDRIGNYIDDIEVSDASKKQFNSILLQYFDNHFGTNLHLKSLRFL
ncbi:MAG: DNA repair protein RecO [Candidatus Cloacimonadota bacterium]|nr:DNA repair protein RecO [Candidatus Cloacimonadota bacterium]